MISYPHPRFYLPTLLMLVGLCFPSSMKSLASETRFVATFLDQYCIDCHDEEMKEGDLDLTALEFDVRNPSALDRWVDVYDRVMSGEMPPKKKNRPEVMDKEAFLSQLERQLFDANEQERNLIGRAELRRLNRSEYAHSLQEILDLPYLDIEGMLPPDGLAHGFSKSADALDFSHVMVSRYMEVADHALWQAVAPRVHAQPKLTIRSELKSTDGVKNTLQTLFVQLKHGTAMPLIGQALDPTLEVDRGDFKKRYPGYVKDPPPYFDGVATFMNQRANHNIVIKPFKIKQSGYYKLRVHGFALLNDHGKLLPSNRTETIAFYVPNGRLLGRCDLPPNEPATSEVKVWLEEGEPVEYLAVSVPNKEFKFNRKDDLFRWRHFKANGVGLQWFELEGPLAATWPPESHKRLFGELPLKFTPELQANGLNYEVVSLDPLKDARLLLEAFLDRAIRRPVLEEDFEIPMVLIKQKLDLGASFMDAMLAGYRAVLSSPDFLIREEHPGPLNHWSLANRLSFFLWNSPPDETLLEAAKDGSLLTEAGLLVQIHRMLNDPKVMRFVKHFLDYWLDLRKIQLTEPDENLYPEYNALLTESMVEESHAFFLEMLRNNLGISSFIDSDFIMINQRLARLYQIPEVHGSKLRRVSLGRDSVRGGLVTQASLLKLTANGTTTSPVVRGTFLLSRILGDPPPPPPPAVPAVDPDISGATTIREQLRRHREDPACATCHQKIDPPGFALESFDVMGGFRTHYRASVGQGEAGVDLKINGKPVQYKIGPKVDSTGVLPDGSHFENMNELRSLLSKREPQIARHFLEQLVVYATGAPVQFVDRPVMNQIMEHLKSEHYGLRSMIIELVKSDLFKRK